MKVLFAASEAVPFAKTGGLADVAGTLPAALAALGHDVRLVLPRYRVVDPARFGLRQTSSWYVPLGSWRERCDLYETVQGGVTVYFIAKDLFFDRPGLYGTPRADYPDNAERFIFFSRAVLELCSVTGFSPRVIHSHDWQTACVPLLLRTACAGRPEFVATASVFTIHNMGYQGIFPPQDFRFLGVGGDVFTPEGIEFWGRMNLLKAGLVFADALTTVSRTYAAEIQTPEHGYGLDGVLRKRSRDLQGILNGIDYALWNPAQDRHIAAPYSAQDLSGKTVCRAALRRSLELPDHPGPIIGMVTRLAAQKGIDLVVDALPALLDLGAQIVILGTGDELYQRLLSEAAQRHGRHLRVLLAHDDATARAVYAGSDLFLMPSRYEPCGLGQMIALRYGTVPVVRRTGGLADTVEEADLKAGSGTGFLFDAYSAEALITCCGRAVAAFADTSAWRELMRRGMAADFSWERSAREYESLYRTLAGNA